MKWLWDGFHYWNVIHVYSNSLKDLFFTHVFFFFLHFFSNFLRECHSWFHCSCYKNSKLILNAQLCELMDVRSGNEFDLVLLWHTVCSLCLQLVTHMNWSDFRAWFNQGWRSQQGQKSQNLPFCLNTKWPVLQRRPLRRLIPLIPQQGFKQYCHTESNRIHQKWPPNRTRSSVYCSECKNRCWRSHTHFTAGDY